MGILNPIPAENPGQGDAAPYVAAPVAGSSFTIQEVDGTPAGVCTTLVLPNGTLAIVAGVATYTPAAASIPAVTVNPQTASYSLVAADCAPATPTLVKMNVAGANTLTFPLNATIPIAIGSVVGWMQYGAGQITHTPAVGVTLRSSASLTSRAQYSSGTAMKIGTDEWLIDGDLS